MGVHLLGRAMLGQLVVVAINYEFLYGQVGLLSPVCQIGSTRTRIYQGKGRGNTNHGNGLAKLYDLQFSTPVRTMLTANPSVDG